MKEMTFKDIQKFQKEFDEKYFSKYWADKKNVDQKIEFLKDMTIALTGELGEFANTIKKVSRDWKNLREEPSQKMIDKLKDELTDCFIYLVILSNILKMDVQEEYMKKVRFNDYGQTEKEFFARSDTRCRRILGIGRVRGLEEYHSGHGLIPMDDDYSGSRTGFHELYYSILQMAVLREIVGNKNRLLIRIGNQGPPSF